MARVEQSIEVNVPLSAAYNQWTQFEDFPRFMEGVREVRQLDDAHLHWRAQRHGREVEWDSEITEQVPDQRIEWRDVGESNHSGSIIFQPLGSDRARVRMTMEFEPAASGQGSDPQEIATRIGQDLERFKKLIEARGQETGAWRGEIHQSHSSPESALHDSTEDDQRTIGQTASERVQGGSATHPSGRWESWTDESAFGSATGRPPGDAGSASGPRQEQANQRAQAGMGDGAAGAAAGASTGFSGAQAWLRNQFPRLEEPIGMVRRMSEEMDQLFERFIGRPIASRFGQGQGGVAGKWMPQVEVVQQDDALLVSADLPGIKREDVSIEVLHDRLTIEGERREQQAQPQAQVGYKRSERCYGRFYRMIPLPHGVEPEQARASMQDGVLVVRIPMPAAARQPHRVDIK
jgi:HSP20 family molecular chaperone IbpA